MNDESKQSSASEWDCRPITFQGVTFPASLMALDILDPVLDLDDEEFTAWLWKLTICRGRRQNAPAEECTRYAQQAIDLMLEHRQRVLDGIRDRCSEAGFEPEATYRDWMAALQRIVELSRACDGDCVWSAPSHPKDRTPAQMLAALEKYRASLLNEPPPE